MRINTTDMQNAFGKYLALVEKEDIVITKNGKSIAKLIRYNEPDYFLVHEEAKRYQPTKTVSYGIHKGLFLFSTSTQFTLIRLMKLNPSS